MMRELSLADKMPLDFAVPLPPPVRAAFYILFTTALILSMYSCLQAALMIYDFHQTLEWMEEVSAR